MPLDLIAQRAKTEDWLGGLDSNQDNQIQNLMYCQLYDLPTVKKTLACLTICDGRQKQVVRRNGH